MEVYLETCHGNIEIRIGLHYSIKLCNLRSIFWHLVRYGKFETYTHSDCSISL